MKFEGISLFTAELIYDDIIKSMFSGEKKLFFLSASYINSLINFRKKNGLARIAIITLYTATILTMCVHVHMDICK